MPSASAGLELPATSLIAPLLFVIPLSRARSGLDADLIQAGCWAGNMNRGLVPADKAKGKQGVREEANGE
jgi:hypothetical protein